MVCAYSISTCDRFPFLFLFDHIVKNTNCLYTVYISFKGIRINVDYLVSINTEVTLLSHSCSLYFFPSQPPYSLSISIYLYFSLSLSIYLSLLLSLPLFIFISSSPSFPLSFSHSPLLCSSLNYSIRLLSFFHYSKMRFNSF